MIHELSDGPYWIERLNPCSSLIASCLPKALKQADDYFLESAKPFERSLFAMLTRHNLQILLNAQKYVVVNDDDVPIEPYRLANVGLQYIHDGIVIKIWKAAEGFLPIPATTSKVEYLCQQTQLFPDPVSGEWKCTEANVVYLWDYEETNRQLKRLVLVCSRTALLKSDSVDLYWQHNVPIAPPEAGAPPVSIPPQPTQPTQPREEPPISLPDEEIAEGPTGTDRPSG